MQQSSRPLTLFASLFAATLISGPSYGATFSAVGEPASAFHVKMDVSAPLGGQTKSYPTMSGVRDASFYGPGLVSDAYSLGPQELPAAIRDAIETARPDPMCDIACKGYEAGIGAGLKTDRAVFSTLFNAISAVSGDE